MSFPNVLVGNPVTHTAALETNFFGCGRLFPPAFSNFSEMFRHLSAAFLIGDEGWRASSSLKNYFQVCFMQSLLATRRNSNT